MKLLNIIYYFIWRFWFVYGKGLTKFTDFTLKPLKWLIFKIPFVKNRFVKLYGSVENARKEARKGYHFAMNNKDFGIMMWFAWCFYGGTIMLYMWGIYYILAHYFPIILEIERENGNRVIFLMLSFVAIAGVITYFASYRKDVFKKYFRKLDKVKGWERFAYKVLTFVFVFGSFLFWFLAMDFAHH